MACPLRADDYDPAMKHLIRLALCLVLGGTTLSAAAPKKRLLFFSKSSGFEHPVISWKGGQPSFAEKILMEIGAKQGWEFEFSKDGSKFSKEYLSGFNALVFYTSGDLTKVGKDQQPAMTADGEQALFNYIRGGGGFVGLHCASDTFHTPGDAPADANGNNTGHCSPYICMIGGEFITHGAQQTATNKVIDPGFPGYEHAGESFTLQEEWYALKNFNHDMHALTVIDTSTMQGPMYKRPPYPTAWARMEGKGRVYYNAMGHRDDVWTSELYQNMLIGAIRWASGDVQVALTPNLEKVAPEAAIHPAVQKK